MNAGSGTRRAQLAFDVADHDHDVAIREVEQAARIACQNATGAEIRAIVNAA